MTVYRRKKDSDVWHWCKNCPQWPTKDFEEFDRRPRCTEKLCEQCKERDDQGWCKRMAVSPKKLKK